MLFNCGGYPETFSEAMTSRDSAFWKEAINDKMESIMGNNTWVFEDIPCYKPLGCKWIFIVKCKPDGSIIKFKDKRNILIILIHMHRL